MALEDDIGDEQPQGVTAMRYDSSALYVTYDTPVKDGEQGIDLSQNVAGALEAALTTTSLSVQVVSEFEGDNVNNIYIEDTESSARTRVYEVRKHNSDTFKVSITGHTLIGGIRSTDVLEAYANVYNRK